MKSKSMEKTKYEAIIGLEIHVELATKSKMFCGCDTNYFGKEPNTHCCPTCLGLPGALPVPNKKAVKWCVLLGLALNCKIPDFSKFDRKNYFYPDLPKGYQISQYDKPLAVNGSLKFETKNGFAKMRIRRVHLEEDTGKLIHTVVDKEQCTLIDFNRSGVPLVEIVTEPDIGSSEDARSFLKKLRQIILYLGISDADMEKGSMRLEPNISVRKRSKSPNNSMNDTQLPEYKVEVKNINSFSFVKKAIDYEIKRQIHLLEYGRTPKQETRGWDEKQGKTYSQRGKEKAHDYRYFPEPDIPPIRWDKTEIRKLRNLLPELPQLKLERFVKDYSLSRYYANILTSTQEVAQYYEDSMKYQSSDVRYKNINSKIIADWIVNKKIDIYKISPEELVKFVSKKQKKTKISNKELNEIVKKVVTQNPKAIVDYKKGKKQVIMFLVGQIMRKVKGKTDVFLIKRMIIKSINKTT